MHRAISEVHQLLRMVQAEHRIGALMAGVGSGRGIALADRYLHLREPLNRAGPSAIAHHLKLVVPVFERHPELHLNARIGRRHQRERHATVGGQHRRGGPCRSRRESRRTAIATAALCGNRSSRNRFDGVDLGVGNRSRFQLVARRLSKGGAKGADNEKCGSADHNFKSPVVETITDCGVL